MHNIKKLLCATLLIVLAVVLPSCTKSAEPQNDIPEVVRQTAENYFEAFKQGTAEAEKYAYFPTESSRMLFLEQTDQKLESYKIEKIEKLTENLYGVTVNGRLNIYDSGETETVFGFVGKVDGSWLYIGTAGYIPDSLKEDVDLSAYQYSDPDIL